VIGVRLAEGRLVVDRRLPAPRPGPGEAEVRLRLAGICGTDRALLDGYADFEGVLGHEFVGEVAAAPQHPSLVGRRVVGRITVSCGACRQCREGRPGHCENRRVLGIRGMDGVFAERFCLPAGNLVPVPQTVPDEAAVFAEPLAAALRVIEQVPVASQGRWLVIGAGALGQLIARVLSRVGCRLQVLARYPGQRRKLAAGGIDPVCADDCRPRRFDVVVDATGSAGGFAAARRFVRPGGTVVLKSSLAAAVPVDLAGLVVDEVTVIGSRCGPLEKALRWLADGRVDPVDLVEARFALEEAAAAFARAAEPGAFKVLFTAGRA